MIEINEALATSSRLSKLLGRTNGVGGYRAPKGATAPPPARRPAGAPQIPGAPAALALALALFLLTPAMLRADSAETPKVDAATATSDHVDCLWRRLDPYFRLRLALAARWRAEDPAELIARVPPEILQRLTVRCGFDPNAPMIGLLAQYWTVRAAQPGLAANLRSIGIDLASVENALDAYAPPDARRALAIEIMGREGEAARRSIRAAIAQIGVDQSGRLFPPETPELLARYFANRILIDGLEAGARAPEPF